MARKPVPERRDELERAIGDYVLAHGIADLSLRPLAEALGVSTYALIYHFASKEGVIAAAVAGIEERQRVFVTGFAAREGSLHPSELLRRYWYDWCLEDALLPYHRLFYEVYGLALQHPERYPGFLERGGWDPWMAFVRTILLRAGLTEPDAEAVAALMLSTVAGALLGVLTSGDARAPTRAVEIIASDIERVVAAAGMRHGATSATPRAPQEDVPLP